MGLVRRAWNSGFVTYYWLWCSRAFRGPLGLLALASTIISFAVPIATHLKREWGEAVNALGWEVALGIIAAYATLRVGLAPYWIWRDDHPTVDPVDAQLGDCLSAGSELMTRRIPDGGVMPGMMSQSALTQWTLDADDWIETTRCFLEDAVSPADAAEFMEISRAPSSRDATVYRHSYDSKKRDLRAHIRNLRGIRRSYLSRRATTSSTRHA